MGSKDATTNEAGSDRWSTTAETMEQRTTANDDRTKQTTQHKGNEDHHEPQGRQGRKVQANIKFAEAKEQIEQSVKKFV
jgi:hypothetical protein